MRVRSGKEVEIYQESAFWRPWRWSTLPVLVGSSLILAAQQTMRARSHRSCTGQKLSVDKNAMSQLSHRSVPLGAIVVLLSPEMVIITHQR